MSTDKSAAAARELVERWMGEKHPITMQSYVSDLTALIGEHYVAKAAYIALENTLAKAEAKNLELLQQRDELKEALISLMWQFAYYGTKNNVAVMHTGGLSALEDAFSALGLSDPITVENFEAAIKNTER
jgi:hypothetical protein